VIVGPPGTGKTRFLTLQTEKFVEKDMKPMICSLTKAAASEIGSRVSGSLGEEMVGTLHAHCMRAIGRNANSIAEIQAGDFNKDYPQHAITPVRGVGTMDDLDERQYKNENDEFMETYTLLRHLCRTRDTWPNRIGPWVHAWEEWKADMDLVDFTDLIEQAAFCDPLNAPDVLMADEAQDMSRLELKTIKAWSKTTHCSFIVGDPYQALYVWRGAYPGMFSRSEVDEDKFKILKRSYRVPQAGYVNALALAQRLTDYEPYEYRPTEETGGFAIACQRASKYTRETFGQEDNSFSPIYRGNIGGSKMVMASCAYMLNSVVAKLKNDGTPFSNKWRRRNAQWNPLHRTARRVTAAERLATFLDLGHNNTVADLIKWTEPLATDAVFLRGERSKVLHRIKKDKSLKDKKWLAIEEYLNMDHLLAAGAVVQKGTMTEKVAWYCQRIIDSKVGMMDYPAKVALNHGLKGLTEEPSLSVGTICSFKGAEADHVFIDPALSPAAHSATLTPEGMDAALRMFYVAYTRARHSTTVMEDRSGRKINHMVYEEYL